MTGIAFMVRRERPFALIPIASRQTLLHVDDLWLKACRPLLRPELADVPAIDDYFSVEIQLAEFHHVHEIITVRIGKGQL